MIRSTDRIVTTHAGRLPSPPDVMEMVAAIRNGESIDRDEFTKRTRRAISDVIEHQQQLGIDSIGDGEIGKSGGFTYYSQRLAGLHLRPLRADEPPAMSQHTGERLEFAEFYAENDRTPRSPRAPNRMVCNAPISYIGEEAARWEIDNFKAALEGKNVAEAFMCVLAPGWIEHSLYNEFYKTDEEFLFALADAMAKEYRLITDAGFLLQIDDPGLPDTWDMIIPRPSIEEYRKFAQIRVEALNHALKGIPEEQVRYHTCWGSWHGPHIYDIPLADIVDLMLSITAASYSVEAANPRHEHEWKVWRDTKLSEGKVLIPGVVSHASNVVEHPELVADRLELYASLLGKENVIAGTDCGLGLRVHHQLVWAKLKVEAEGAAMASKNLWQ